MSDQFSPEERAVLSPYFTNLDGPVFALVNPSFQPLVGNRDLIVVQDLVMLLTAVVLVVNFLIDLSYRFLDPRIRSSA